MWPPDPAHTRLKGPVMKRFRQRAGAEIDQRPAAGARQGIGEQEKEAVAALACATPAIPGRAAGCYEQVDGTE